jgi:argininosuccinate lyase
MGDTVKCLFQLRGEPYGDMLPMCLLPDAAMAGIVNARLCIQFFTAMLTRAIPQKERMLKIARAGYSCATEVAVYLIREKGYGGRMAHTIVSTMIRQARVKGLKSYECTGRMLDEAAEYLKVDKPDLDDATLHRLFDPVEFIHSHTQTGGTAPAENARLLSLRAGTLAEARRRQQERLAQIDAAAVRREAEITNICSMERE